VSRRTGCVQGRKSTVEDIIELAVEIAREGREGRKIGTLFVIGSVEELLQHSRPLILDPLYGHPPEVLQVTRADFRETVKELAQLDGAFLVADDGTFVSAGRFVEVDLGAPENFLPGSARATPRAPPSAAPPTRWRSWSPRARSCACSPRARSEPRSSRSCS
jgi:hypothetical protein